MNNTIPLSPAAPAPHYEVRGKATCLFSVVKCDKCGEDCEAPNTVGGVASDVPKYKLLGMTEREMPLETLVLSDNGDAVCDSCYNG